MKQRDKVRFSPITYSFIAVDDSKSIDVSPAYVRDDYQYIKKSHKTLLIFRRLQKKSLNPLELRH
jgi:hypothetical protein